jgi:hypothetical protein
MSVVEALLNHGANVNEKNEVGMSRPSEKRLVTIDSSD